MPNSQRVNSSSINFVKQWILHAIRSVESDAEQYISLSVKNSGNKMLFAKKKREERDLTCKQTKQRLKPKPRAGTRDNNNLFLDYFVTNRLLQ